MMKKVFRPESEFDTAEQVQNVTLRIKGLRELEPGLFELQDVKLRSINWELVKQGFGGLTDEQIDKLAAVLWKDDMINLLLKRME